MHWNTVTPLLREILEATMSDPLFSAFRLVGGTALSLQFGHRESVDIDLFSEAPYGSIDFNAIEDYFRQRYAYVDTNTVGDIGIGTSYYIGHSENELVKIDIYYTDLFIRPEMKVEGILMSGLEDIIAMKLEIIARGGRKKDFWDLHTLHDQYDIPTMIDFYFERYPYNYSEKEIRLGLSNFATADNDPDPICLRGKHWELIKLDFAKWYNESNFGNADR